MRSFMSAFAAFAIRCSGWKKHAADPVWRKNYFEKLRANNDKPYTPPPFPYRSKLEKRVENGVEVLSFRPGRQKKLVYLHGGSFCEPPRILHLLLCDHLAAKTDHEVLFPLYKRAPAHTFEETFAFLETFYRGLLESTRPEDLVLMGDSSGGGLSLSFCEYLKTIGLPQPAKLVLLSPVLDAEMAEPFPASFDKTDPSLQIDFLREACRNWAGDADVRDWRISPISGDFTGLAPITLLVGGYEAFVVQARRFRDKCMDLGVELDYREYPGMNHVFVIYPIPEANRAQGELVSLLRSEVSAKG